MISNTTHPTIERWLEHLHRQAKSRHTLDAYRRALAHFVRWSEGSYGQPFEPGQLIARDVADWQAYQQTVERAKPATINQRMTALSRFCAWAVSQDLMVTDPTGEVRVVVPASRRPRGLSERELRRLLRAVHGGGSKRDIALVEVLAGTGLRVSELLALTVGDVDLNARSGTVIVRRGKHGGSRSVPLTAAVRKALADYLEQHPQAQDPVVALWLGERGPLRDRSAVTRLLAKYAQLAQIDLPGPHTLRHTFATRYLAANPHDLRGLAALLGHASLNTVMVYTEPREEELVERMERVGSRGST